MTATIVSYHKIHTSIIKRDLFARDGYMCQHPDCKQMLDPKAPPTIEGRSNPLEVTIDHWFPQYFGKANGWSMDRIWAEDNLKLMHKKCNAKKGDLIPNEDGTLPKKAMSTFQFRRLKRATRPEICGDCQAGRLLGDGQWCNACGCGPNPGRYPKWRQMGVKECDHDLFYCVSCTIWFPEQRRSVLDTLLTGGNGYE